MWCKFCPCNFLYALISGVILLPDCSYPDELFDEPYPFDDQPWNFNLEKFLQPIDVGRNRSYDNFIDDGIICTRDCSLYPTPRICYYKFTVEQYHAMGPACGNCSRNHTDCFSPQCVIGDGIERTVLTINRMIPAPAIHVCYGDRIIVDVFNKMPGKELVLHWHGLLQKCSPYMDGVAYVTQCPIDEGATFRYDFRANTKGTHFYHSHLGFHMLDGLSGVLIVRNSRFLDPISKFYTHDLPSHTIHITEWMHVLADDKFPGFNKNKSMITLKGDSYLLNGMGSYTNPVSKESTGTPWATFKVRAKNKYRFRIIGLTSLDCSMRITFEGHSMRLIATDGYPVMPEMVRTLYITSGDIFDVVIHTKETPRAYWIRAQGLQDCVPAVQYGVLQYEESEQEIPSTENTEDLFTALPYPDLNNVFTECSSRSDSICMDEIRSVYRSTPRILQPKADIRLEYHLAAHIFTNEELYLNRTYHAHYLPISGPHVTTLGGMVIDTLNNKTNIFPSYPIYMQEFPDDLVCPKKCDFCECLNMEYIPLGSVVEITVFDDMSSDIFQVSHPMHAHGYHFEILKVGSAKERKTYDFCSSPVRTDRPCKKDSVAVPPGGFVIIRIEANNPGMWVFHCHITFHHHNGMLVVFQVGKRENFRPYPMDWPTCGDYLPPVDPYDL